MISRVLSGSDVLCLFWFWWHVRAVQSSRGWWVVYGPACEEGLGRALACLLCHLPSFLPVEMPCEVQQKPSGSHNIWGYFRLKFEWRGLYWQG